MSSPNLDSVLPDYWEVGRDSDPVPPELLLGGPRFHCRLDGTRVWALQDAVAHGEHFHAKTEDRDPGTQPQSADDAQLRSAALDLAIRSVGAGVRGPVMQQAETILAFLRAAQPPIPPQDNRMAPAAAHEALDRVWATMHEDESGLKALEGEDGDQAVREVLRGLTDEDLRRTIFAVNIVRLLGIGVGAQRAGL